MRFEDCESTLLLGYLNIPKDAMFSTDMLPLEPTCKLPNRTMPIIRFKNMFDWVQANHYENEIINKIVELAIKSVSLARETTDAQLSVEFIMLTHGGNCVIFANLFTPAPLTSPDQTGNA